MKAILKSGFLVQPLVLSQTPLLSSHLLVKILITIFLPFKKKKKQGRLLALFWSWKHCHHAQFRKKTHAWE